MLNFIFSKLLGLFGGSSIMLIVIGVLTASTATAGYLLQKSYKSNGSLKSQVVQWQVANDLSIQAYKELNKTIITRNDYNIKLSRLNQQLNLQLSRIKDESNCLDTAIPDDVRVLLQSTSDNTMSSTTRNTD